MKDGDHVEVWHTTTDGGVPQATEGVLKGMTDYGICIQVSTSVAGQVRDTFIPDLRIAKVVGPPYTKEVRA